MHGCTVMVFERRISPADIEGRTPTPSASTGCVMIGNRAACVFAGIITVLGTLTTSGRLLASVTIVPPSGAGVLAQLSPVLPFHQPLTVVRVPGCSGDQTGP